MHYNFKTPFFCSLFFIFLSFTQTALAQINLVNNCKLNITSTKTYRCAKNVAYGLHKNQKLDVWLPNSTTGAVPLVVFVHGGGYYTGDKSVAYSTSQVKPERILDAGMAFATINYRLSGDASYIHSPSTPYPPAMIDSARALQYLRLNAGSLSIDKNKVALSGTSAGGGISLWLTLHDNLAISNSRDPLFRESTRVNCAALLETQTTLNISEVIDLLSPYNFVLDDGLPKIYGIPTASDYLSDKANWDATLAESYYHASPISHISADDTAKMLFLYSMDLESGNIHSPEFGIYINSGMPFSIKNIYNRSSLYDINNTSGVHYSQSSSEMIEKVNNFLINDCFK